MLERVGSAGIAACAWLCMAWGGSAHAAGDEAPGGPGPVGKNVKSTAAESKSPGTDPAKAVEQTGQGLGAFGKLLPLGQKNRDVKIPSFRDGNPSSLVQAATMTRLEGEKMEMERLDIRMYGETEEKDLRILMPTATYHMATEVLSGDDRSRITRKDFDLRGDTLIFDTRTRQGKMTGHIHMIIRDADSFRRQPDKPAASGSRAAATRKTSEKPMRSIEAK